ncbi:hypothetical protein LTR10_010896 [Elasticomyces elasticus]|nr:hypothetical protein LTR10_010896 [Elasticomyces elasticus]
MAHEKISHRASTETQPSCRLLSLAAELRNASYELVFDEQSDEPVELLKAQPPSNALLLACHTIYAEAVLVYKHAYRGYWTGTAFTLLYSDKSATSAVDAISAIHQEDCDQIITENFQGMGHMFMVWTYLGKGLWKQTVNKGREGKPSGSPVFENYTYFGMRPGSEECIDCSGNLEELKRRVARDPGQPASMKKVLQKHISGW